MFFEATESEEATRPFLFFYCPEIFLSCSFKAVGVQLCRDADTVTPEWIAQATFFFSFPFKNNASTFFLLFFFVFWKNDAPSHLFLRASEKKSTYAAILLYIIAQL